MSGSTTVCLNDLHPFVTDKHNYLYLVVLLKVKTLIGEIYILLCNLYCSILNTGNCFHARPPFLVSINSTWFLSGFP